MTDREDYYEFEVTLDPGILSELYGNPPELVKQFEGLYREAEKAKDDKIIHKLKNLISKYPNSPQLKIFQLIGFFYMLLIYFCSSFRIVKEGGLYAFISAKSIFAVCRPYM